MTPSATGSAPNAMCRTTRKEADWVHLTGLSHKDVELSPRCYLTYRRRRRMATAIQTGRLNMTA